MLEVKNAIRGAIPGASYASWFVQDRAGFVEYAETSRGFLVMIAPTAFFRDTIKHKFLRQIVEAVKPLGFKYVEIIKAGDPLPTFQPRELDPEQWSELKAVLAKIGQFARSAGNHKASSALFTSGIEEDIVEVQKPKPTPSYVYRGTRGLALSAGGNGYPLPKEETPTSDNSPTQEGVIFPAFIDYSQGESR